MASSNRHWPSMFKSKSNCSPHQWAHLQHHDLLSSATPPTWHRSPFASVPGGGGSEERSPEPKPRWNPKPEQIRILEAIFNSGMVNPPRDEIRKIRAQLQEFGQVGDANVFYWFQNRKSRSKHKLRNLRHQNQNSSKINQQQQQNKTHHQTPNPVVNDIITTSAAATTTLQPAPSSSSSSSSDKSSPKGSKRTFSTAAAAFDHNNISHSPTTSSLTHTYFQSPQTSEFLPEPFFFPGQLQTGTGAGAGVQMTQGFCFSEQLYPSNGIQDHATVGPCTSLLLSEILNSSNNNINAAPKNQNQEEDKILKMQQQPLLTYTSPLTHANIGLAPSPSPPPPPPPPRLTTNNINHAVTVTSAVNHIHRGYVATGQMVDSAGGAAARSAAASTVVVFINDVAFEVGVAPFNVREAFGDDVLLIQSSGHPVLTNEWGVTLQSLHHGAFYYLVPLSITAATATATQQI